MSLNTVTLVGLPCAFVTSDMLTESFLSELLLQQDNLTRLVVLPEEIGSAEMQGLISHITSRVEMGMSLDECLSELPSVPSIECECQVEALPCEANALSLPSASASARHSDNVSQSRTSAILASIEASLITGELPLGNGGEAVDGQPFDAMVADGGRADNRKKWRKRNRSRRSGTSGLPGNKG